MFDKLKDARDQIKMIKELKSILGNTDLSDPTKFIEMMGIDMEEMNKHFEQMNNQHVDENLKIDLKFVNNSENKNPNYEYTTDSGFDLRANEETHFLPFERKLVSTGLFFDIPEGFEIQVRTKSGLAINHGLVVLNSPGTVDQGYTGEVKVILMNMNNLEVSVKKGQKIAQAVLCPVSTAKTVNLIRVSNIEDKDRNSNGFGSTGL